MLDYINEILGFNATMEKWEFQKQLPGFLRKTDYWILNICRTNCLVIKMNADSFNIVEFEKLTRQMKRYCDYSIVLWFDSLDTYQRKSLIKNQVSFVVPQAQLYMPFLAIYLSRHLKNKIPKRDKLTAMAQYVLLYFIYDKEGKAYNQIELAEKLDISTMNVSRAVYELKKMNLLDVKKVGKSSKIKSIWYGRQLYEKAKDYLQSPVQRKIYVQDEDPFLECLIAGEEAYAQLNFNLPPHKMVRAIDKKLMKAIDTTEIVNPDLNIDNEYIELELWKYNPELFAQKGRVDVISLALSMYDDADELDAIKIRRMVENYEF